MVVGEAPGEREDDSGKPFVGRSGVLLERALESIGLTREDVYITNAVRCRPENNRAPTKTEIRTCKEWLDYEMKYVQPRYVLLLGNTPLQAVTGEAGIKRMRGKPFEKDGVIYLPTWHPAYVLRDPRQESVFEADLKLFRSIIDFGGIPREKELDYIVVDSEAKFERMLRDLRGTVAIDGEMTRLYAFWTRLDQKIEDGTANEKEREQFKSFHNGKHPKIISFQFGTRRHQWVLPMDEAGVFSRHLLEDMMERVTEKLEDCFTVFHNGKFDCLWAWVHYGVRWRVDFDTMLAHYIVDENNLHDLKGLAQLFYGAPDWDVDLKTKTSWNPRNAKYAAHDVFYTRKLRFTLGKLLNEDGLVKRVYDDVLLPCANLFVEVEYDGIFVNEDKMDDAEEYLRGELAAAKRELDKYKKDINWGSPQQVGRFFFEELRLKPLEKTKSGKANSVSESVLQRLDHPAAGALLKWRAADKQLNAFIEGWKPYIDMNGFLHPSFKLHGTVTGRLSCEHPNLQQVPRDERIRSLLCSVPGWTLLEVDLSQIELRITAELANEATMLHAFRNGIDIHWLTAMREIARGAGMQKEVLATASALEGRKVERYADAIKILLERGPELAEEAGKALDINWKENRKKAKAINFGYVFGMWWKKFKIYARDNYGVTITDKQAQESREFFFEEYSALGGWHERQRRFARHNGYVRSLAGRKRRLPDAMSSRDTPQRAEALRQAINSPVQSFANDLNLMAALQLRQEYGRSVVRLSGTVHDACLLAVRDEHLEEVHDRMLKIMQYPEQLRLWEIELSVPLEADAKIGPWGAGVKIQKWLEQAKPEKAAA